MIYGIIGTGAIGGYYGGKLAHAGKEVHFLLHKDYEYVCQHGLQIDSCDGDFHLDNVNAYSNTQDMPKCDVVMVGLKSTNNRMLKTMLPPLLKSHTLVLLIQNGIGLEHDLQREFPNTYIAAGLAFICSAKTEPGHIENKSYGNINIGNYSCKDLSIIDLMVADLNSAGVKAKEVEYDEARWKKAVWNMPFNGMTVALNTQTDKLISDDNTAALIRDLMMEVIGAAQHLGVKNIDGSFADQMMNMTRDMVPYSPSMKLDYDFHRPMEIYYLYSRPIEEARTVGFRMPKLEMLEAELKFLERKESK